MLGKILLAVFIIVIAIYIIYLATGELHPLIAKLPELVEVWSTQSKTMLSEVFK